MKLETRLSLLLGSLLAVLVAALVGLHAAQRRGTEDIRAGIALDKARILTRVLALDGGTLERFASDYTQWDEMCTFIAQPDPAWAQINIQQSLASWKFHAAWVFDAEQREIHRTCEPPFTLDELASLPGPEARAASCRSAPQHYFVNTPRGLLEIRTSPIHPSDDARLNEPPRGWLFAARLWSADSLVRLGELTDSTVTLKRLGTDAGLALDKASINLSHPLPDWQGRPLHQLTLHHTSPLLDQMIEYDGNELLFYLLGGCAFIGVTAAFLHNWVRRPLRTISESLQHSQPWLVASLLRRRDEFAEIAALIQTAEEQRLTLHREVQDRTYAVQGLRRAIADRAKLGRDLHDGVIQSIYAAGLTLQGMGPLLHSAPTEAERRLALCVEGLNRTIVQLRRHIDGMEDPPPPAISLVDGLQQLLNEMRPVRAIDYRVEIDPLLAAAIPNDSAAQLLLIAREALSNALRHSAARCIGLRLNTDNSEAVFTIEDDGGGFEADSTPRRGHGLDNMTRRAEEIGAVLLVESTPGRGTRIRVELPRSDSSPDLELTSPPRP